MKRGSKKNRSLDVWVGVPMLNLLATLHRRRRAPGAQPRSIGVMCSPALGDTLLFSGALQDLRVAFPGAQITHICMPHNLAAAEIIPGADDRLLIRLTQPLKTVHALRARRFDVLLDFTSWQRLTALYTLLAGAAYTVGFRTAGQRRSRGFDLAVEHRNDVHETVNFRQLLLQAGLPATWGKAHIPALAALPARQLPFSAEPDLVALHLWASGQRAHLREWPGERWIALARQLAGPATLFVITGAPGDRDRVELFAAELQQAGLRAASFLSPDGFVTLAQVLRRARLVVSVNTGVMHLAAIAGAPTVGINGPNRNGRWGPVGPQALGVEAPGPGCGFLHLGFNFDGNPTDCMHRISVEDVADACAVLLAATTQGNTSPAELKDSPFTEVL